MDTLEPTIFWQDQEGAISQGVTITNLFRQKSLILIKILLLSYRNNVNKQ